MRHLPLVVGMIDRNFGGGGRLLEYDMLKEKKFRD